MQTIYVLIVVAWGWGGATTVSMQEVSSLDSCNAKKQMIIDDAKAVSKGDDSHIRVRCEAK